jgi:ZIP family zinc transporter/zinc and cadmium transporter
MSPEFANTLLYSLIAGGATLIGVYLLFIKVKWAERNAVYFLSFSAGVVLTVAFTHMIPEGLEFYADTLAVVLFTIIGFYILEHTVAIHTCHEDVCETHRLGLPTFIGISTHSLVDGIAIGVGFEAGFEVGIAAALAILLHRVPVGITVTALLFHAGYSRGRMLVMGWIVALATAVGAVGTHLFVKDVDDATLGFLLAFSAGSFIYIGASDLLPETHKNTSRANILLVLVGVGLVYLVTKHIGGH